MPRPATPVGTPAGNVNAPRQEPGPADANMRWAERGPAKRPWAEPWAVAGLCLGGAGLLSASFPSLCPLVMPLSATGLLAAAVGLWRARVMAKSRLLLPLAAAATAGAVLCAAWWRPGLLGPIYQASRPRPEVDPAAMRVVPLPGSRNVDPASVDWVDASQAALQQGATLVRITDAWIGPARKPITKDHALSNHQYLFIRVQVFQTKNKEGQEVARPLSPGNQPRLTDDTGNVYPAGDGLASGSEEPGKGSGVAGLGHEEVFAFQPPGADAKYLRIELPGARWSGTGLFRFTIPAGMIRRDR